MNECSSTSFFNMSLILVNYRIDVKTGDAWGAGTNANVRISLHGLGTQTEEFKLDRDWRDDFKRGRTDEFCVMSDISIPEVTMIKFWRDSAGFFSNWYVDYIEVTNLVTDITSVFPVMSWITARQTYSIDHTDTCLPQDDPFKEIRALELKQKQTQYQLAVKIIGGAAQVKDLPEDEKFSFQYQKSRGRLPYQYTWPMLQGVDGLLFNIASMQKTYQEEIMKLVSASGIEWRSVDDVASCYTDVFGVPKGSLHFNDDTYFGRQRLAGLNSMVIKLCTEIPEKFGVKEDMISSQLEGKTLQQALDRKRMFIIDYEILEGAPTKSSELVVPAPIALFYFTNDKRLLPVAIQLYQQKGPSNPVFLPTDPEYTWMMAKMWFNLADATYHQALSHLTLTHLVMEGIAVVSKRQLSPSHPILRLLNPHFLYLMPINANALVTLTNAGGIIDQISNGGQKAVFFLLRKGLKEWRLDVQGTLPEDLKSRKVYDKSVLNEAYYVRDDALMIYNVIKTYVGKYVRLYYGDNESLKSDYEIQAWGAEIVKRRDDGGVGMLGVPNNGKFETAEQLIDTLTAVIYICSVGHAAVNFQQYDEYGAPFNYPYTLKGTPPTTKDPLTADDVLKSIGNRLELLKTMSATSILSEKSTNSLGDFEEQYIEDPAAVTILNEFRKKLKAVEKIIDRRNAKRKFPYDYLHPKVIPNAISI